MKQINIKQGSIARFLFITTATLAGLFLLLSLVYNEPWNLLVVTALFVDHPIIRVIAGLLIFFAIVTLLTTLVTAAMTQTKISSQQTSRRAIILTMLVLIPVTVVVVWAFYVVKIHGIPSFNAAP